MPVGGAAGLRRLGERPHGYGSYLAPQKGAAISGQVSLDAGLRTGREIVVRLRPNPVATDPALQGVREARRRARNYSVVMATSPRRLTRSRSDRKIAGVCGGIAEHFGWDPTLVRIVYVVASVVSAAFPGVIAYLLLWLIMPASD